MEGGLHEKMQELGYGCTATREDCRETFLSFGVTNITPAVVARVLGKYKIWLLFVDFHGLKRN